MLILTTGLVTWFVVSKGQENSRTVYIPFTYSQAKEIDPEGLTAAIMNAIGYPDAVPIVTVFDRFSVNVYSKPAEPEKDLGIGQVAFRFTLNVPGKNGDRQLAYEANNSIDNELAILYLGEIEYSGLPNEIRHPKSGYVLADLFSSIRDFPAKAYRELTQYGAEHADVYQISFNDRLRAAEELSYDTNGLVLLENIDGIPLLITNMQWGAVRDESLAVDDPKRYSSMGGQNGINLNYYFRQTS
ncbi:hypothetical protein A7K91_10230 [Paenibacillus oryzae]|uniref:Uncharacterized protein n=1 Tax=Paenibacillus oryzae TaxID=1844972 RepID=A0A1A5YRK4_9BACL|nr:hypothetical protein [Paenibacillus oryzae]OBR68189.1 hypothetical protein A7K91_10230 [Paenibacillus oryzae]